MPKTQPNDRVLLLPLDSRPVCGAMVQKLGRLAAIDVIVPPKALLDNYQQPAAKEKLLVWLEANAPAYPYGIVSADLLLHGGLLQSRQRTASFQEQTRLADALQQLWRRSQSPQTIFSVIPRLLVSDELLPDRWYQYHLMRYSQLLDMTEINNDPYFTRRLLDYQQRIPSPVLEKYLKLYEQSQSFNSLLLAKLCGAAPSNGLPAVVIGQDDASPLGLPHRNALRLENLIERHGWQNQARLTYGADEIAALLLARRYLQTGNWQPKINLQYADPSSEFKYMPYMAVSVNAALRSQAQLLGAQLVDDLQDADIICYINCGDDNSRPGAAQVENLQKLLRSGKPVALIDASANFAEEELLLPQLLAHDAPLNRLAAYAGWNTFSNSSGTALAQAVIFSGRLRQLRSAHASERQLLALYAANLRFSAERIVEDYFYQKRLHPWLRPYLESFGVTPTALTLENKPQVEARIQTRLSLDAWLLLHRNLGRTPFFQTGSAAYYLRDLTVGARLPWNRIFEVDLNVGVQIGKGVSTS
ncbi:DUF4127 family protein [Phascolarctobacterium sp.]|uniref:DUF4127 family protein n=1 Tax=Phascolarctobacterium sp. TaxID=2049039 RepID=UPI0026DB2C84|nr:DUF4127 family protein [Phascolarctobacterium sp.]